MSATSATGDASFRTASEIYHTRDRPNGEHASAELVAVEQLVVRPVLTLEAAARVWNDNLAFRDMILSDKDCFDVIDGAKEMNRTGATRLAVAYGLSIEELGIDEGQVHLADTNDWDYRFRVRVRVTKGGRHVDGIGSCRTSEIEGDMPDSKREHFALTRAWTRATKRAIADILGGTEA